MFIKFIALNVLVVPKFSEKNALIYENKNDTHTRLTNYFI